MNDYTTSLVVDQSPEQTFEAINNVRQCECYGICSNAWGTLMHHSLPRLITAGEGHGYR